MFLCKFPKKNLFGFVDRLVSLLALVRLDFQNKITFSVQFVHKKGTQNALGIKVSTG